VRTDAVTQDRPESPSAAPGELELVRSFANTLDVEAETDRLGTATEARDWLIEQGVELPPGLRPGELRSLIGFREAIREAVAARGTETGAEAIAELNRIASAHAISVRLGSGGAPFAARSTGVDGFIERVLGIVATAAIDGSWERLKACPNDRCRWLFYDHSRNRSRTWCSMGVCGARSKMRTYRSRHRASTR